MRKEGRAGEDRERRQRKRLVYLQHTKQFLSSKKNAIYFYIYIYICTMYQARRSTRRLRRTRKSGDEGGWKNRTGQCKKEYLIWGKEKWNSIGYIVYFITPRLHISRIQLTPARRGPPPKGRRKQRSLDAHSSAKLQNPREVEESMRKTNEITR